MIVNTPNVTSGSENALSFACMNGYVDIVKKLIANGNDVHCANDRALQVACFNGHLDIVNVLLDAGADVHAVNDAALRFTSHMHPHIIIRLIDAGANVEKLRNHWKLLTGRDDESDLSSKTIDEIKGLIIAHAIEEELL